MIESIAYEIIKQEGLHEGRQQGLQQGLQQGMLDEVREMVLRAVGVRSRAIPADVEQQVQAITSRVRLGFLLEKAICSTDIGEFREALQETTRPLREDKGGEQGC